MFNFAKKIIGNRVLKQRAAKMHREKKFYNIESIKSLGVLFENTDDMYVVVNKMIKFFMEKEIKISAIAFENIKNSNAEIAAQIPSYTKIFTKSELTWYNKPNCEAVNNFISEKFDVMIDMSRSSEYVYKYVATMSMAKFKIGGMQYKNDPFDLILLEKSGEVAKFVNLIINFLSTIKVQ